jgi:hypothetical protein
METFVALSLMAESKVSSSLANSYSSSCFLLCTKQLGRFEGLALNLGKRGFGDKLEHS